MSREYGSPEYIAFRQRELLRYVKRLNRVRVIEAMIFFLMEVAPEVTEERRGKRK